MSDDFSWFRSHNVKMYIVGFYGVFLIHHLSQSVTDCTVPPVFKGRTYVVSQLEVFLACQLIVHSFDQLQDLQGRRRKNRKKETSCWMLSDCCCSHKERRPVAPSASSIRWDGEGLSELGTHALDKPRRRETIDGVYCDRGGERLLPSAGHKWRCEPADQADC